MPRCAKRPHQFEGLNATSDNTDRRVDTRQVRGKSAAPVKAYRRGSKHQAVAVGANSDLRAAARRALAVGMFAKSSKRTLLARRNAITAVLEVDRVPPNVVTPDALLDLAASLGVGGYRSAFAYLVALRLWAIENNQQWTDLLHLHFRRMKRSLQRGLGPPRRAIAVKLHAFRQVSHVNDGPLVGALWLMRGAELRSVLGDQVVSGKTGTHDTIQLAATKTDATSTGAP